MNQSIKIARNKTIYESREATIEALNTSVVHQTSMLLMHLYNKEDGTTAAMITVGIADGQGSDKYQVVVNEVDLAVLSTYTNETPMWINLGGMEIGDTFDKVTYNDMFTKLLYPYVAPTISLAASPGSKVLEKGTSHPNIVLTATTQKFAQDITEVVFLINSAEVYKVPSPKKTGGKETYTHPEVTENSTFQAQVYDGRTRVSSNTFSYTFVYPAYIGKCTKDIVTPTADVILAGTKKIQNPGTLTSTYTYNDEKCFVALPTGWTLSSIKDASGYEIIDSFRKDTVAVVGTDGQSVNYNVYTMIESVGLENFTITFTR